jgi:ferrous iron transport protein B
MSLHCNQSDSTLSSSSSLTIALAGNPNSGKTTVFNALTGLRQKVANYPGVTVEKKTGRCKLEDGSWAELIDLPGTYSLISRSPDETVAMEVLRGIRADVKQPDAVIVVVDASNLQRNLYLVSQLIELGRPMVVALNMMDIAERRGIKVSPESLEKKLGVPVIPIVGHRKQGIDELKRAIRKAMVAPMPDWPLPEAMKAELLVVGGGLAVLDSEGAAIESSKPQGSSSLGVPTAPRAWICNPDTNRRIDRYEALAERLLIGDRAADIAPIASREPVSSLLSHSTSRLHALGIDPMQADVEAHYRWIEGVAAAVVNASGMGVSPVQSQLGPPSLGHDAQATTLDYAPKLTLSERVDRILLHKIWGLAVFTLIMAILFVSIFWLAQPIMDGISAGVKTLGVKVASHLADGPVKDLVTDGIFAGVGAVVVFVPQIALLFMFLSILEDSGYLSRAAFLMDRLLAKVGLHGKSFIPLLSSFACAIPGIMATRTIENRKDRLATIFIAPFMSCSARLPVYALLIGTFFATFSPAARGGIMLSCYGLGILAAVGTAWIFKRTMLKGAPAAFILELPTYKVPQFSQVVRQVWVNTSEFVKKAGTTIFCLSVILWAMTYYPRLPEKDANELRHVFVDNPVPILGIKSKESASLTPQQEKDFARKAAEEEADKAVASAQLRHSIAGRFGHFIEPAIRPLGFDWKMGVGLVGAFAAREVFVSTMAITYAAGDEDNTQDLAAVMRADTYASGKPVWTPLVAISLLVWFVLAMQCMSTLAIVKRETGGWKWPIGMLVYMNALAYVVCLAVYQIGRIWWA